MPPISLDEMDGVSLMNRVDTKYAFSEGALGGLLDAVRHDYRVLEVGGARWTPYATLYYDSPARDCFLQHHNGKLNRHKFRVRSYGPSGACFLEVKLKNNKGRTDKRRIAIPGLEQASAPESLEFIEAAAGVRPNLAPQLWTYFSRITLVGLALGERVTLDTELTFAQGDRRAALPGVVIAEVKQARSDRGSSFRQGLRRMGLRPLRISKYCVGSLLLDPALKHNRFKPKLLALQKLVR
ncbi:VTC domain protein [Pirellulimonas nuda]|uniref:VTC domain protein n=1 Tax=Pirellulimonas nuda TaxID=2528009 RepID=A0A518DFS6_9BACT|nr:polyphosphate polymerase domain-containing protein [Pirellulimonas nuda]QDU90337.1 VTC domain protein [Pirellulimonas nuda]